MIINAPSVKPMDVPESGSLTRPLLICKTRMGYFLRLELLETTIDSKQLLSAAMPALARFAFSEHIFSEHIWCADASKTCIFWPPTTPVPKKIRAAIEGPESRLPLETLAGCALTWTGMMTLSGRYAEALTELGLKPGDRAGALGLRRRAPGFNSYDMAWLARSWRDGPASPGLPRPRRAPADRQIALGFGFSPGIGKAFTQNGVQPQS